MKLIIGGAYQGKLAYALSLLKEGQEKEAADGVSQDMEEAFYRPVVTNLQEYVRRLCDEDLDGAAERTLAFCRRLALKNPEAIVVCREVGCGVVPVYKRDRIWREAVGEACQFLAGESEEVVRIVCGIPVKLKENQKPSSTEKRGVL